MPVGQSDAPISQLKFLHCGYVYICAKLTNTNYEA